VHRFTREVANVKQLIATSRLVSRPPATVTVKTTTQGSSSENEVQTVTLGGPPSGGTFTLRFEGQTTRPIDYNAPNIGDGSGQDALVGLSNIAVGDVAVTGTPGGSYTVTFGGALAKTNVSLMYATSSLQSGPATVTVATTRPGGPVPVTVTATVTETVKGTGYEYTDTCNVTVVR